MDIFCVFSQYFPNISLTHKESLIPVTLLPSTSSVKINMDAKGMEDILKSINTSNEQISALTNFVRAELQQTEANTDSLSNAVRQITSDLNVLKANWQ